MQRRIFAAVIAALLGTAAGYALLASTGPARADGYEPTSGPTAVTPVVSEWVGAYGGANGGYSWNANSVNFSGDGGAGSILLNIAFTGILTATNNGFSQDPHAKGFVGGVQGGYNWRVAESWVAGLETDLQYADVDGNEAVAGTVPLATVTASSSQDLKWFGTLRGRLGFLPAEHLLLFGTGGLAYGKTEATATVATNVAATATVGGSSLTCLANVPCISGSNSETSFGWTLGAGFEWIVWHGVTVKGEYLHVDLGDQTVTLTPQTGIVGNGFANASFDNAYEILRVGVNVPFNSPCCQ